MTIIFLSILAGAAVVTSLFIFAMRKYMITAKKIDASFEQVCINIEKAVKTVPGWGHPMPDWDFHAAVGKTHYFDNLAKKRIFFICNAGYASRIVDKFHHMGAMMPCAWSVYETATGEVYIAKMNIGLMSKMLFGNILGSTMGKVAREERVILRELNRLLREPLSSEIQG